ncbi:MAG: Holliday junction branch migration protein RuvA [Rhodobacteraceae bacterium]|nr:Holliday junction branch migration protein RuvA [Paracoccaceae bacterium]
MIGSLSGRVTGRSREFVVIDVGGVGYIVHCSERTLAELPPIGSLAKLYTDLLVREDLLQLFGFCSLKERELHKMLISVQGVGAKAALAVVGALGVEGTIRSVTLGDVNAVRAAPGVGPRLAQRIVNELREKITAFVGWTETGGASPPTGNQAVAIEAGPAEGAGAASMEAHSALVNLGYQHIDAARAVAAAAGAEPDAGTEDLIREALLRLTPA